MLCYAILAMPMFAIRILLKSAKSRQILTTVYYVLQRIATDQSCVLVLFL